MWARFWRLEVPGWRNFGVTDNAAMVLARFIVVRGDRADERPRT